MQRGWAALPLALMIVGLTACGGEEERLAALEPNSARVALTVDYPGSAPLALITYRAGGRRCHALGTVTDQGPRVLGDRAPLYRALERRGGCLGRAHPLVSVQLSDRRSRPLRVLGGLARHDVIRLRIAGQRVRPDRGGAFLVGWPAGTGDAGRVVEVMLRDGTRHRVPLELAVA